MHCGQHGGSRYWTSGYIFVYSLPFCSNSCYKEKSSALVMTYTLDRQLTINVTVQPHKLLNLFPFRFVRAQTPFQTFDRTSLCVNMFASTNSKKVSPSIVYNPEHCSTLASPLPCWRCCPPHNVCGSSVPMMINCGKLSWTSRWWVKHSTQAFTLTCFHCGWWASRTLPLLTLVYWNDRIYT